MESMILSISDFMTAFAMGTYMGGLADACQNTYPGLLDFPSYVSTVTDISNEIKSSFLKGWDNGIAMEKTLSCSEIMNNFNMTDSDLVNYK